MDSTIRLARSSDIAPADQLTPFGQWLRRGLLETGIDFPHSDERRVFAVRVWGRVVCWTEEFMDSDFRCGLAAFVRSRKLRSVGLWREPKPMFEMPWFVAARQDNRRAEAAIASANLSRSNNG